MSSTVKDALSPGKAGTLAAALQLASTYWETKRGNTGEVMPMRARTCAALLKGGLSRKAGSLSQADAIHVLAGLKQRGLSASSQAAYYAAFRRMLALAGVATTGWPSGAKPPRQKAREPLKGEQLSALQSWFLMKGYRETADLLLLLMGTGCRVEVEALDWDALRLRPCGTLLEVTGKGGHTRLIPVGEAVARLLRETDRLRAMRVLSYDGHLKRWNQGVKACGIDSRMPTPHAVRHWYATEAYKRSGKDLRAVQELLGHADVSTTARYVGVDEEGLRHAAGV